MNLSDIARSVFQNQLQAMLFTMDGCIVGQDPIHLHDLRVANRRIRAALIEFKELLPDDVCLKYQQDFRWIHHETGKVRDYDVGLSYFSEFRKEIPKSWRPHLKPLRNLLEKKREIAQEELSVLLQSEQVNEILDSWSGLLNKGIITQNALSLEPAREFGCRRIIRRYNQMQKDGQKLAKNTPAEEYHDFRIQVKKMRYLMEFFNPVLDQEKLDQIRQGLKTVQDTFGMFQDTEIQAHKIKGLAEELFEEGASLDTMLALGHLLGMLEIRLSQGKKKSLKRTRWLISEATARMFQSCFQYPVE